MNLLARREHSFAELVTKLSRRFTDAEKITEAVLVLRDEGLQSDQRFAEAYINSGSRRGLGPTRLRRELQMKRVSEHLIAETFAQCDIDWVAERKRVLNKKFGQSPAEDARSRARQARFLYQRGFEPESF